MGKLSQLHADAEQASELGFDPHPRFDEIERADRHTYVWVFAGIAIGLFILGAAISAAHSHSNLIAPQTPRGAMPVAWVANASQQPCRDGDNPDQFGSRSFGFVMFPGAGAALLRHRLGEISALYQMAA